MSLECGTANQSESAKEKIGENIEMLLCLICMGTPDRTLIDRIIIIKLQ